MNPKSFLSPVVGCRFCAAVLFFVCSFAQAADFERPGYSDTKVSLPSVNGFYYVVQETGDLREDFEGGEVFFGDGSEREYFFDLTGGAKSYFYRVTIGDVNDPADLDGDGIDDLYELARPGVLDLFDGSDAFVDFDKDGRSNLWEYDNFFDPAVNDSLTTFFSSPRGGESDVAVTRETVLRFTRPLKWRPTNFDIKAEAGGKALRTQLLTSSDFRTVTVFYRDLLPSSSRVRLTVQGGNLKDADGNFLDPDFDGLAGGVGVVEFDTLALTTLPKTAVYGRVFASEVGETGVESPLSGVRVYVDGRENELFAFTDEMGDFRLEPVPAGTFFVHIDGKLAQGEKPHVGYYPLVGKAWQAEAGRETSVGEIYLPLIREGTLTQISASEETVVKFPDAVLAKHPELVGVQLNVPAGALVSQNGRVSGAVGIAPVNPDRLPGPLPEGLSLPLVITVQSDGPGNFDTPVPACFPNLPDPETGETLPPGAKSALWSFDHDAGRWVVMGAMTVSADGKLVCTDPGVGIVAPGWHGSAPGVEGRDGDIMEEEEEEPCESGPIEITYQDKGFFIFRIATPGFKGFVKWSAPSAFPDDQVGNVLQAEYCEAGTYTVTAFLIRSGKRFPCHTETITVTVTDDDIKPLTVEIEEITSPNDNRGVGVYRATSSRKGLFVWVANGDGDTQIKVLPSPDALSENVEVHFCDGGDYTVEVAVFDRCGLQENAEPFPVVVADVPPVEFRETLHREDEGGNVKRRTFVAASVYGNAVGDWNLSVTPSTGVVVKRNIFNGAETQYDEATDSTVFANGLIFCETGTYTVTLTYEDELCGEFLTDTIEFNVSEAGYEFVKGIEVSGEGRSLAVAAIIEGDVSGVWTWSVTPAEGAKIEPFGMDPISNAEYFPATDQTLSLAKIDFCKDGTYSVQLDFRDNECGAVISATKTIITSGVELDFENGIIELGNPEAGISILQAELDGEVQGIWNWSVSPSEGVTLNTSFLGDEEFFYSRENDKTFSVAHLTFCEAGVYEVQLTYLDELCGEFLSTSKTIVSNGRTLEFKNGLFEPFDPGLPGVKVLEADIAGRVPGIASWGVSPSFGVTINTEFFGEDEFFYDETNDVTRFATEFTFCTPGTYQVSLVVLDEGCGKTIGAGYTLVVTDVADPCTSSEVESPIVAMARTEPSPAPPPVVQTSLVRAEGNFLYYIKNLRTGRVSRGKAGSNGFAHPSGIRLRPNTRYEEYILSTNTLRIAKATWKTPDSGNTIDLPRFILGSVVDEEDRDFDGLSDLAELIVGTNPEDPDTDDDGLLDGPEVLLGTNPNDKVPFGVGLVNELGLEGETVDVAAVGDFAVTASGEVGVHIVNIFNGRFPVLVATVDTPGLAQAVACGERFIAVADGDGGLAIIERRDPANESTLARTVGFEASAVAVAAGPDLAYVGLSNGEVVVVELSAGRVLNRFQLQSRRIEDLVLSGNMLYVLQDSQLYGFSIGSGAGLLERHVVDSKGGVGAGGIRMRLFAGNGFLYVSHLRGYNTFDIGQDGRPNLVAEGATQQFGWKQVVSGGSGLAVAAVSANSTLDGDHNIAIYNDSDNTKTNEFLEDVVTPGIARSVALANGLAYVADSASGLSVAAYHDADTAGVAPTAQLSHNFAAGQVEENGLLVVTAEAIDDVQVRDVQFFVDGVSRVVDGSYPYQLTIRAPALSEVSSLSVRAIARDTSGNASDPVELNLEVVADATPVEVFWVTPAEGKDVPFDSSFGLSMQFSEPVANFEELEDLLQLFAAGDDGALGTEDDVAVPMKVFYDATQRSVSAKPVSTLVGGGYRAVLLKGLKDGQGRAIQEDFAWSFSVVGVRIESFEPMGDVQPYSLRKIGVRADRALNLSSITADSLTLERLVEGEANVSVKGAVVKSLADTKAIGLELDKPMVPGVYKATARGARDLLGGQIPETTWQFEVLAGRAARSTPGFGTIAEFGLEEASLVFNLSLDPASVTGGVELRRGSSDGEVVGIASLSYSDLERRVRARFAEPLVGGDYFWKLTGTLRDFQGFELAEPTSELGFKVALLSTSLTGVVEDEGGNPLADAIVSVAFFDIEGSSLIEPNRTVLARTDVEGVIRVEVAALGEISLDAFKETLADGLLRADTVFVEASPGSELDLGTLVLRGVGFAGDMASGVGHTIWVDANRTLWGVGANARGQLGNGLSGAFVQSYEAVMIGEETDQWNRAAAGRDHSLAIKTDGSLWAWGSNALGQLGDGSTIDSLEPTKIGDGWNEVDAGGWFSVGIQTDGTLWSWGYAPHGKVTGTKREPVLAPEQIGTDTDWAYVDAGMGYVLALKSDGSLWGWGANGDGQLGDGTKIDRLEPARIGSDANWAKVVGGVWHSLGIRSDGTLWAWGSNASRQLGDGTQVDSLAPMQIGADTDWSDVSCNGSYSLARKVDGSIWDWGDTYYTRLPGVSFDGQGLRKSTFEGSNFLSAGYSHVVYAVGADGVLLTGSFTFGEHTIVRSNPPLGTDQGYRKGYETMELDFMGDLDPAGAIPANIIWLNLSRNSSFSFREGMSLTFASGTSKLIVRPSTAISPASFYNLTFGAGLIDVLGEAQRRTSLNLFSISAPNFTGQYPENFGKIPVGDVTEVSVTSEATIKAESVDADGLRLFDIGPDGLIDTADDVEIAGAVEFDVETNRIRLLLDSPLPLGNYFAEPSFSVSTNLGHTFLRRVFGTTIRNFWFFAVNEGPEIVGSDPSDGSTYFYNPEYELGPTSFTLTFSQVEIDEATLTPQTVRLRVNSIAGPILTAETLSYDVEDRILTVEFAEPLPDGTYFIELSPDIEDSKGRKLILPVEPIQFNVALNEFGGS